MTRTHKLSAVFSALALSAAAFLPLTAEAGLVTRQFLFSSTAGALQFGPQVGSFTYDDAVVPAAGGLVAAPNLFKDLQVSFGGFSFDELTANSGWLRFDATGDLLDAAFGNNCSGGGCSINAGWSLWWIRVGKPGASANDFAYSGFNGESGIQTSYQNQLLPQGTVPEPASVALVALALVGAAGASRARRQR
ncbi:PEP-CTERM sorting domain-containing protein [Roseateles sp. BYS87W]|uniref:PEP-CTERM sorting domain-containing protein n=1 Tax=Pelomonas baiyunensis TaxID=3299026 RepID=A0ABW7GSZ6_9BURK